MENAKMELVLSWPDWLYTFLLCASSLALGCSLVILTVSVCQLIADPGPQVSCKCNHCTLASNQTE
jgi:hypothetical protein